MHTECTPFVSVQSNLLIFFLVTKNIWWRSVLHYCTFPLIIIESEGSEDNEVCFSTRIIGNK